LDVLVFADGFVAHFKAEFFDGFVGRGPVGKRGWAHVEDNIVLKGVEWLEELSNVGALACGRGFAGILECFDFKSAGGDNREHGTFGGDGIVWNKPDVVEFFLLGENGFLQVLDLALEGCVGVGGRGKVFVEAITFGFVFSEEFFEGLEVGLDFFLIGGG
jgi:hypothetical protein